MILVRLGLMALVVISLMATGSGIGAVLSPEAVPSRRPSVTASEAPQTPTPVLSASQPIPSLTELPVPSQVPSLIPSQLPPAIESPIPSITPPIPVLPPTPQPSVCILISPLLDICIGNP